MLTLTSTYRPTVCLLSIDFIVRNDRTWDRRCVGIDAMLLLNQLAYTAQPLPKIARVDLAAIFFDREKLASENLFFSKSSRLDRHRHQFCTDDPNVSISIGRQLHGPDEIHLLGLQRRLLHPIPGTQSWLDVYPTGHRRPAIHRVPRAVAHLVHSPGQCVVRPPFREQGGMCISHHYRCLVPEGQTEERAAVRLGSLFARRKNLSATEQIRIFQAR